MSRIRPETRAQARRLRASMTVEERLVWHRLRELNRMLGLHFRRQAPLGPYIADFADLGRRLVIEIDGGGHGGPQDASRDAWLAGQGFRTVRFWNTDVRENLDGVMQRLLDESGIRLDEPPPTPALPHEGGGARRRQW